MSTGSRNEDGTRSGIVTQSRDGVGIAMAREVWTGERWKRRADSKSVKRKSGQQTKGGQEEDPEAVKQGDERDKGGHHKEI